MIRGRGGARVLAALLCALAPGLATAQSQEEILAGIFKQRFMASEPERIAGAPEEAKRRYVALAYRLHPEGHVSQESWDAARLAEQARLRAARAQPLLALDLNADGRLAAEEIAAMERRLGSAAAAGMKASIFAADTDGDGELTIAEMLANGANARVPGIFPGDRWRRNENEIRMLLGMDLNGDGVTVPAEIIEVIDLVAAAGRERSARELRKLDD